MNCPPPKSPHDRAFTLLEMLCAITLLSIMMVVTGQMVGSAMGWAGSAKSTLDATAQSRGSFDRIGQDLSARIQFPRESLRVVKNANGNDTIEILSDVRNRAGDARFSRVSYSVASQASPVSGRTEPMLYRLVDPVAWSDEPQNLTSPGIPASTDLYADGCFRLEVAYVDKDGTLHATPPSNFEDVSALVVGMAFLDATSRLKCSASDLADLASRLGDAQDGKNPLEVWNAATLPQPGGRSVRFSQRTFYLNQNKTFATR